MLLYHLRELLMLAAIGAAFAGFLRIQRPRPRLFRLGGALIALAFLVEVIGYVTKVQQAINAPFYNSFIVLEFLLVLAMVHAQQPAWNKVLLLVAGFGLAGFVVNARFVDWRHDMLFEAIVLFALLLAIVLGALLWRMANTSAVALLRVPDFWLFTGMLLYFIALPPVMGLARYLRKQDLELASTLWTIMPALCMARYLLTAYACWLLGSQQRAKHE
jgi:hypothetical protein